MIARSVATVWTEFVRTGFLSMALAVAVMSTTALGCGGSSKKSAAPDTSATDDGEDRTGPRRASAPTLDDEEPDDGDVQIAGLKGRLDAFDINRGLEPHKASWGACFTDNVGRQRYLGGPVEFKFVINPDGTVKTIHFLRSELGAWKIEKCMLDIGRSMTFARPKGRAEADFTVPLAFEAQAPVKVWGEARAAEEVDEEKTAELAACAQKTETRDPQNIWIVMYVGPRGQVLSVGFASPDGPLSDDWASCAEGKVKAWTLTDPRGRAKMLYHYNP